jgi:hypothetical protein
MTTTTTKKKTTKAPVSESLYLPNNPFVFEVLDLISSQRTNQKKVEVLQKYAHDSLKTILIWNFDDTVISLLPPGDVPYSDVNKQTVNSGTLSDKVNMESRDSGSSFEKEDLDGRNRTSLRREYQTLYNFVKGGNNSLSQIRREMMFINILEALHPREAELLCLVKDGKLSDKYKITFEIVKTAYPDIVWGGRS